MCIISRSLCSFFEGQINIESNCFNLFSRIFLKLKEEVPSIFVFSRILGTYFEIYCMRRNQGGLNSIHWGIGEWKTARTSGNGVPGVLGVPVASLTALQNFICITLIRGSGTGAGEAFVPTDFGRSVNSFPTRRSDHVHHITTRSPPPLLIFRHSSVSSIMY